MVENPYVSKLNSFILGKPEQSGTIAELNCSGFDFPTQLDVLLNALLTEVSPSPLIVLTGNAGDGKSHLIFKLWLVLTGRLTVSAAQPPSLHSLSEEALNEALTAFRDTFSHSRADAIVTVGNYRLVKDASAIVPAELEQLLVQALFDVQNSASVAPQSPITIVSINEGILRVQLTAIRQNHSSFEPLIQQIFIDLEDSKSFLSSDELSNEAIKSPLPLLSQSALVLNLNTRDIGAAILRNIVRELAQREQFALFDSPCGSCPVHASCPIRFNVKTIGNLEHPAWRRLALLFDMLNQMGQHVTLREALSAIAHLLTGNLSCCELQAFPEEQTSPEQLSLFPEETIEDDTLVLQTRDNFLLRVFPYLFFNSLFVQAIRQQELLKTNQSLSISPFGRTLSQERLLLSLGQLDPGGYATPSTDVWDISSRMPSAGAEHTRGEVIRADLSSQEQAVMDLDHRVLNTVRIAGQRTSAKGIPDPGWFRSLVIAGKRHAFFYVPDEALVLKSTPLSYYNDFKQVTSILSRTREDRSNKEKLVVADSLYALVGALNQFQQPRTIGNRISDRLDLIQRDHAVLFANIPTTKFELILAAPPHSPYIEHTQLRIRFRQKKTLTFLDCDLLLYELLRRFVNGSLSYNGLEPRTTNIKNFLTKLRSETLRGEEKEEYVVVGRAITFSFSDGQIIVQAT